MEQAGRSRGGRLRGAVRVRSWAEWGLRQTVVDPIRLFPVRPQDPRSRAA